MRGLLASLGLAVCVAGCMHGEHNLNTHYLDRFALPSPTPAHFTVCHGFNCVERTPVSLTPGQWRQVAAVFKPRARTARQERAQIARAVAMISVMVGPQAGTNAHQWTHKHLLVLPNLGDLSQVDCVDASVNTWTYMTMMERDGLLSLHKVAPLSYGGSLTDPDLRNTAVLKENDGGYFAVDASLVDYNEPPLVMPLDTWLGQWPPAPGKIERVAMAG